MPELLVGCGNNRTKRLFVEGIDPKFKDLVTLDIDPGVKPDVVHDISILPLPFADNTFDEIHAYDVLEHCGVQGDWKFFFAQWTEFWRIIKPSGFFCATVPAWNSPWAWGDPGHTRVLPPESLVFLNQTMYEQVGKTAMTDYRPWWKGDFILVSADKVSEHQIGFVLQAKK